MWHKQSVHAFAVDLVPLAETHLEQLRAWRNSAEVAAMMLSQPTIDAPSQRAWFERVRGDRAQAQFVISYKGEPIGACNLKSHGGGSLEHATEIEVGFYLGSARFRGTMMAFFPALALNEHAFEAFAPERLIAKVKPENVAAVRFNAQLGYRERGREIVEAAGAPVSLWVMDLERSKHVEAASRFSKFVRS